MPPTHRAPTVSCRSAAAAAVIATCLLSAAAPAADEAQMRQLHARVAQLEVQAQASREQMDRLRRQAAARTSRQMAARRALERELVALRSALSTECDNAWALARYGEHANAAAAHSDSACD